MPFVKKAAIWAALLLFLSPLVLLLALRIPRGLPLEVGPGDAPYVQGLHSDWRMAEAGTNWREMERRARLQLPVTVRGPGQLVLALTQPEREDVALRVTFDDGTSREITVPPSKEFRPVVIEIPEGRMRASVRLRSGSGRLWIAGARWEASAPRPQARLLRNWLILLAATLAALALARLSAAFVLFGVLALLAAFLAAAATSPFAFVHWIGVGAGVSALGLVTVAVARVFTSNPVVLALLYFGILLKSAPLLHPSFYFADMPIHETLLELLYHRGVVDFWRRLPQLQVQYRLGLSPVGDDYQAYPYSVLFYFIAHAGNRLFHAPDFWLKTTFGIVCALPVLPIAFLSRKLSGARECEFVAGIVYLAAPAYTLALLIVGFSSLLGHFCDLLVVSFLAATALAFDSFKRALALTGLVVLSLAAYNSGFISIGLLFASVLILAAPLKAMDWGNAIRFAAAGLAGAALALLTYHPSVLANFLGAVVPVGVESASTSPPPQGILAAVVGRLHLFVAAPLLVTGTIGVVGLFKRASSPGHRLLLGAWALSGGIALVLRYALGELLRHEKEMYWIAALLSVGAGVLLGRLYRIPRWGPVVTAVLLVAIVGLAAVRFARMAPVYYEAYRFL